MKPHTRSASPADRDLRLEGCFNARDLGGITAADGRKVRRGMLLRTDDLHRLTHADRTALAALPLRSVVDFRAPEEVADAPYSLPVISRHHIPIRPGSLNDTESYAGFNAVQVDGIMLEMYREFVTDPAAVAGFREFFRIVQTPGSLPLLFHCSAGKDRTGLAAALLLTALGAARDDIMADYMASDTNVRRKYAPYIAASPGLEPMFVVEPHFLQASFSAMTGHWGSVEDFLRDGVGADTELLRRLLLE